MITVLHNSVDITDQVIFPSLLVQQNLTNEVDNARFVIRKVPPATLHPVFNDDIQIMDGATAIFAGKVVSVEEDAEHADGSRLTVSCVDHTLEMDRLLASRTYENETIHDIIADLIDTYAPDFTYANVTSSFVIQKIVFNQLPLSQCLRKLADIVRFDWYVDEDKDVHFFPRFANLAPFDLTDTAGNHVYRSLLRTADGSQIVNRVKVRGGEYDGTAFTDIITVVGNDTTSFNLPYRMANLEIELDTGGGFVAQDVGIDFIDTFDDFDVLYNFQGQSFRFENPLTDSDRIRFTGNPKTPVLAIAEDTASVLQFGAIEKLIRDTSIASNEVARKRATAELLAFAEEVIDARFTTYTPGLRTGMLLDIHSDIRGIEDQLLIKTILFRGRTPEEFRYEIRCISTQRYTLLDILRKMLIPEPRSDDEREVSEQIFAVGEIVPVADEAEVISPFSHDEEVTTAIDAYDDAVAPGDVEWVWGYYTPSSVSDVHRMGRFDRDTVWQ